MTVEATSAAANRRELLRRRLLGAKTTGTTTATIPPAPTDTPAPLSSGQRRLWVLDRLRPGGVEYLMPIAARLRETLDDTALTRAVDELVARHEVLRTRYDTHGDEPVQLVDPPVPVPLHRHDLRELPVEARQPRLAELVAAEAARPMDLATGPVLRANLFTLADDDHLVLLVVHHIACDGWSEEVLLRELDQLYVAFAAGQPSPLPAPALRYADYATWQRARLAEPAQAEAVRYWRDRLAGVTPLNLPTDRPRPAIADGKGGTVRTEIPARLAATLTELGRAHRATPFMVLLAGFQALLARYTGRGDIAVGTPVAGRDRPETRDLVGLLLNTVVLRTDFTGTPSFGDLLERVRDTVLDAYDHAEVPFERIVEELAPQRDLSRNPLFEAMFLWREHDGASGAARRLTPAPMSWVSAKVDLTLGVTERADGSLVATLDYATALFEVASMQRLAAHYRHLLEQVAAAPNTPLADLALLTTAEEELLASWNDTAVPRPDGETLHGLMRAAVERTPTAMAALAEEGELSYAELDARANRVANRLRELGVGPESVVGVCLDRGLDLVVALMGVLKAGAAYLPLAPDYPRDRLAYMLADSAAGVVLTSAELRHLLDVDGRSTEVLDMRLLDAGPTEDPLVEVDPEHPAYVIYTSGSTGRPKGVVVSHRAIVNRLRWMQEWYGLAPTDRVLQKTPFSFDVSVWEFFWPLATGAALVLARPGGHRDPAYLVELIAARQVTTVHFVPTMLRGFLTAVTPGGTGLSSLRRVICSGEALPDDLAEQFHTLVGCELHNLYGPTEAAVDVTGTPCRPGTPVTIGRPVPNTRAHILDERLRPVPIGVAGQLCLAGVQLARGYHGRPALTAERFVPDPLAPEPGGRLYLTGDLARWRPDGTIEYLGRMDDQIKLHGHRIELGEIETTLCGVEDIAAAAVAVVGAPGAPRLVGYLVPAAGATIEIPKVRAALRDRLPEHMIPTAWVLLDALPTTPSGKTDRKALPAPGPEQLGVAARYVAPRTPMEELVAGVFATATGAEKVGAEDRFFDIGGDSIRAIRAVGVLREAGLDVTVAQIFTHPRVADLAELLQDAPRREAERTVERFSLLAEEDRRRLPEGLVDAYPLSVVQAGMVYEMLADPERSLYQNVTCYRMRDDREFSLEAMRAAIALLVERHEILRTSIDLTGYSEPLQLVAANATAEVGYTDLRGVPAQRQEEIVNEFVAVSRRTPIDVTRAPLLRYHVHQTADHEWRLTHIECHAILDGWSHTSVIAEINTAYRALRGGEIPDLPPPPAVRYADFVNLELRSLRSAEDRAFWEERVRWYDRLALPPDSAEAGEPFEVVVSWRELEPQLRALAAATGTSMKSVLFTAHLKLLGMISGQRRFFASTVANGRVEHRDGDRVYGMHLNTLPFAVDLGAASWRELIGAVFAEETALWPHRRYPLPVMQRNWGGGTPLIDVIFGYLDFHVLDRHRDEVRMTVDYSPNEFTLDVWTFPGQLRMTCRPGWTTRERLEYFAQVFLELLAAMVADPEGDPRRFRPTAADPYALVGPHGAPLPEPDGCLHEVFERQVRQTPDAVAVVVGDEKFTYAECNARANRLAHHLRSLGAGPERTVGICLDRGVDQIVAVLAALKTGGAYVPIDPTIPVDRMAYLIRDAEIVALVTEEAVVGSVPPGTPNVVVVEEIADRLRKLPADDPGIPVHPDNLAYVIYTSGSTGMPKGVMATHGGVRRMFTSTDAQLNFRPGQVWSMFHSYIFDFSVWELWGALLHGGRLVVVPFEVARTPQAFYELLVAEGVTVLNQTPSALRALIDAARAADGAHAGARLRVEKLLVGAEVLNPDMVEEIFDVLRPGRVYHVYGTTEDTMFSTIGPLSRTVDGLPSIGRVVPGSSAYVLDENLEPVLPGAVGEICFGGEKIARGYLARPELTAERFVPDPFGSRPGGRMYRTGDLVRQGPEGELYFLGRRDHQVKLRGYRIELGEIEAALATHPAVAEAVVVVRGADADAHLVAYTTTVPGAAVSAAELRAHLVGLLPGHMVPVHYVAMTAFPRTPSDKLDRRALPEPDYSRAALDQAYTEPRTPQERALAAAFCEVLRLDRIGADDDFFELGGHSLAIMRMIALLRERYGWQLTLRTFVEHRTVARLANVVENTGAVPALVWLRREGSLPPLFCVHPGGGSAHWYLRLLPHLDPEQPLAAFEWPGPHDPAAEEPTTEVMAERYLAELRAAQPHGPYRLFGWCGGSGITTEMAHRLRDAGEEVTFVLLDPGLDSHAREHLRNELRLIRRCQEVLDELDRSGEQADPALREEALALLEHIVDEVGPEGVRLPQRGAGTWSRSVRIWREVMELLMSYRHRPFPGDLDLIVSDELARGEHEVADGQHYEEYLERWRELAGGQVRVHRTAGDHFGVMRAPLVGQLATRIQEAIAVSTARG